MVFTMNKAWNFLTTLAIDQQQFIWRWTTANKCVYSFTVLKLNYVNVVLY